MKTIKFHGSLRALCPNDCHVEAKTVAEAMSALQLVPAFAERRSNRPVVVVEGFGTRDSLYTPTDIEVINVYPAPADMVGAGGRGVMQTIVGAVLIVVGVFASFLSPGASTAFIAAGIGMMAGGIITMLMPQPSVTGQNDEKSRYLSGAKNTVAIGTRIPLVYGKRKVYGHYISFNTDAIDLNSSPESWYASSFTDYSENNPGTVPPL